MDRVRRKVIIAVPKDESDDRHNRRSSAVGQATGQPNRRFREGFQKPNMENRRESTPRFTSSIERMKYNCTHCLRISFWNISATNFGDSVPFIRVNACASSELYEIFKFGSE